MNLKNKVVVITGASKGLGKALASAFLDEQAKVIANARSKKELQSVSKEIKVITYAGNVANETEMKKLANFAVNKFKKIDVWINNAGITLPQSSIEEINPREAHKVMEVNFFGTFYGSRAAMKDMKKRKQGTIINIVSMSSLVGRPRSSLYSSTKWAVRGFTEALRMALKSENISVIAVHPGGIKTTIFGKFKPAGYDNWMKPEYVAGKIIQNLKLEKPKTELIVNNLKKT
jgi:NADP-dependent 3-hydroxy acid dehydrogenase YdfG